ncbi:MAG: hypothetical protein ING86_02895 [Methylobacterium sp.]|nr:hypothetical protein [Methylobacterium sp.]
MSAVTESIIARGDLAHLVLFLWAGASSGACIHLLKENAAANRRFDAFVREIARFNRRQGTGSTGG